MQRPGGGEHLSHLGIVEILGLQRAQLIEHRVVAEDEGIQRLLDGKVAQNIVGHCWRPFRLLMTSSRKTRMPSSAPFSLSRALPFSLSASCWLSSSRLSCGWFGRGGHLW